MVSMSVIRQKQKGFTIVELLIVIVVIGILAAITVVAFNGVQTRAKNAVITQSMGNFVKTLEVKKAEAGTYPLEDYVQTASGLGGYGSYRGVTTYIANIDSLRQAAASRGLQESDIGYLSFSISSMDATGQTSISQNTSAGGYFGLNTYNSTATDGRLDNIFAGKQGFDAKLTAYEDYQRSVLGLEEIPRVYTTDTMFTSLAGSASSSGVRRYYPFTQLSAYCHITNKQCFTYLGYYLYGKTTTCPQLGAVTNRMTTEVLSNTSNAAGGSRGHNMTFCVSFLGSNLPANFPN